MYRAGGAGKIRSHMMLETILANVAQQLLQAGNLHNAHATKCVQRIVGERAFADVTADHARRIVSREAGKAHRSGFYAADDGAECVLFADSACDDLLKIHADVLKKMLRQVAAMEADGFIRIVAVIIVPVEQGAGSF